MKNLIKILPIILISVIVLITCKSQIVNPDEPTFRIDGVWQSVAIGNGYQDTQTKITLVNENGQLTDSILTDGFNVFGDCINIPFTIHDGTITASNAPNCIYDITIVAKMESTGFIMRLDGNIKNINGVNTIVGHCRFEVAGSLFDSYAIHLVKQSINYLPKHNQGSIF